MGRYAICKFFNCYLIGNSLISRKVQAHKFSACGISLCFFPISVINVCPSFGDWLYYALLPLAAYTMLALSAFAALSHNREALFGVGAAALLLLFIGVHNAWDSVAYLVFYSKQNKV